MNLDIIAGSTYRIFLVAIGSLICSLPAKASVTYEFTSKPIFVGSAISGQTGQREVQTNPGLLQSSFGFPPPVSINSPVTASFTLASPLAPNSITPLHLESGGFNLLGPTQGGLQSYSAAGISSIYPITSDITTYQSGTDGRTVFDYARYSALNGQVTTDGSGHISAWNLNFILYDDGHGGGIRLDQSTNPPTILNGFPFDQDALLSISSNPASPKSFTNVISLNGVPNTNDFNFNGADMAFEDRGNVRFTYYTQQPGSIVPEPESWAMMMAGLGLLGWQIRRLKV
jgi:hypothetical protein